MVGHHVTQRTRLFIERGAALYAQRLSRGDLNEVNIVAVPYWLEQGVSEPHYQNILHRLFSQVVIDAIDLVFVKNSRDLRVQLAGGSQVASKGLLHDDA
jgi:hypothetical protein